MGSSAMVQMNTRIDSQLKADGDAVFASLGFTPSDAVRGIYKFAVRQKRNPRMIENVLIEEAQPQQRACSEGKCSKLKSVERVRAMVEAMRPEEFVLYSDEHSWEEAVEDAAYERYYGEEAKLRGIL